MKAATRLFWIMWVATMLVGIGGTIAITYVAWHFIAKWW